MALVRSAGIRGFRAAVAELGGDAADIAERAGLPVDALDSGDMLVTDVSIGLALETAAAELDCADLGLRIGSRQDISLLGPLGLAVRHAATLRSALDNLTAYLFVHAQGLGLRVVEDPLGAAGVTAVQYDIGPARPYSPQGTAMVLAFMHRAGQDLIGGPYGLRTIDLPFTPPDVSVYERHFGVPVRVNQKTALARVAGDLSTAVLPSRDDEVQRLALAMLERHRRDTAEDIVAVVRSIVAPVLSQGTPTVGVVAAELAMHPRTLQRLLEAAGTTFGMVLDDLRRSTAKRLLTTTSMSMAQVAREVGYVEPATFSRRARTWWGMSPVTVRQGEKSVVKEQATVANGQPL